MFEPITSKRTRMIRGGKMGFTLIEILIVLAIIALLAALMFPVFGAVREKGRTTTCMSNLKQIGTAMLQYCGDNDERFPEYVMGTVSVANGGTFVPGVSGTGETATAPCSSCTVKSWQDPPTTPAELFVVSQSGYWGWHYWTWMDSIQPYLKNIEMFHCPSHGQPVNLVTDVTPPYWGQPASQFAGTAPDNMYATPSLAINRFLADSPTTGRPVKLSRIRDVASKILMVHNTGVYASREPTYWMTQSGTRPGTSLVAAQWIHNDGQVIGFCDGHAKFITRQSAAKWSCANAAGVANYNCGYWQPTFPAPS